ncbi:hypothetical protein RHMOL_Rhmol08G0164900 [Rhododendron molle]|uniref:Uncharacterized protein n=1 Tax=Rhododendron molle TaxID=49168 RepID=A0ACC0MQH7_RHOML|nr:hypothetical protein RHMOL_Rhmol08G0164900 [Rhododendron molle]
MVPMHKVNFGAKNKYEMNRTTRFFKHIEVTKLVKGRPHDNLKYLRIKMEFVERILSSVIAKHYYSIGEMIQPCDMLYNCAKQFAQLEKLLAALLLGGLVMCLSRNKVCNDEQARSNILGSAYFAF